ncbi:hypothetical protein K432DRAFT_19324 [Lepidopterella palustris CBS 459.81]|uniref:DUF8035 domain-containing protein n=1 Tax=Lepidopterella palustris CBS 459.81 TaxID=1314670 RepID=A0A8E2JKS1_9PEZI|nr:hypothetical protein K432DRAFT_19324 [Lepidopterella palustris CBS 459.81]
MDPRGHYRPASPRRLVAPGRSSTGTFGESSFDPYYPARSGRDISLSPRTSGDRIAIPSAHNTYNYTPSFSSPRSSNPKYDTYSGRPRRNTFTESDPRLPQPTGSALTPTIPIRTHGANVIHEMPSSPLSRSWDNRGDTYITPLASVQPRMEHKRIYSVDDNRPARLISEKDVVEPRRRDTGDRATTTSSGRTYHYNKPLVRTTDLSEDGYSYTDAAGMYRDTEPPWRRQRHGSLERGARPSSVLMDSVAPRVSSRELGPPPSTRGFGKINTGISKSGNLRDPVRSSSRDTSGDYGAYREADPYAAPARVPSIRHPATVHQDPRDDRRDPYRDGHDDRRERESKRHPGGGRFEDTEVATRGFGIRPTRDPYSARDESLDREPIWDPREAGPKPTVEYPEPYYADGDPHSVQDPRVSDPRLAREREVLPYRELDREKEVDRGDRDRGAERDRQRERDRPRDRERERERDGDRGERRKDRDVDRDRRDRDSDDRGHIPGVVPVAVAAAATTYGVAEVLDRKPRDRDGERERERRKDRDGDRERRDREVDDRTRAPGVATGAVPVAAAAAHANPETVDRKSRDRKYGEEEGRSRRHQRVSSSDDSNEDRPRHYVDKDPVRDSDDRKKDSRGKTGADAVVDPDEEYRRRIRQEQERSGTGRREHDSSDSDHAKERRHRKDRDRGRHDHRDRDDRDRALPGEPPKLRGPLDDAQYNASTVVGPPHSRYDDNSNIILDNGLVQEPDSLALVAPTTDRDGNRVRIVAPPRESPPPPKGILRKPTEKFPEDPNPIREGVAPLKDAKKGKDIPPGARWTKIDRRLVNPQALNEAHERFEERMDCVIVLRVLTKEDIQKLADRTAQIREMRDDDEEPRDRRDRDHRSTHRSRKDDDGWERNRDYDSEDDKKRPRMIESGR